jgi:hypothetical protein
MLPQGASSIDLLNLNRLEKYIRENAERWYEFVNVTRGLDGPNGSLYLITGCDKAQSWEVLSFHNPSYKQQKFTLHVQTSTSGSLSASFSHLTTVDCSVGKRQSNNASQRSNQAVFLRGFKIAVRTGLVARVLRTTGINVKSFDSLSIKDIMAKGSPFPFSTSGSSSSVGNTTSPSPSATSIPPGCKFVLYVRHVS